MVRPSAGAGPSTFQIDLTIFDAHQRIGFEIECADVFLNMSSVKGDTYGVAVIETTEKDATTALPLVTVTLEERKSNENPKIEVITSPQAIDRTHFKRLKTYIDTVVDLAHTLTAAEWAAAASQVKYTPTQTKAWVVSPGYRSAYTDLKFSKKLTGGRLVQCNLDLYLDQLYSRPDVVKLMMAADHQPIYKAAVDTAKEIMLKELTSSDMPNVVGGLLVAAFYTVLCELRWSGVAESLGKDRVQPLLKTGPDDLARLALSEKDQGLLFAALDRFHNATFARSEHYQKLARVLSVASSVTQARVTAIKNELAAMFLLERERYQPSPPPSTGIVTGFGARTSAMPAWDDATGFGNQVWWTAPDDPPSTGTGKPLKPRHQAMRCLFVVEVRKSSTVFAKEMYMDL